MFNDLAKKRRSIRKYKAQPVEPDMIASILESALRAPSGGGSRPWEFIVVTDKSLLEKLSVAREGGSAFVRDAAAGIVVCGDPKRTGTLIEDCSIAAVFIQLSACSMGLGSRWWHMRDKMHDGNRTSRDYLIELLGLPEDLFVECIIAIGYPDEDIAPYRKEDLPFNKIHYNRYGQK